MKNKNKADMIYIRLEQKWCYNFWKTQNFKNSFFMFPKFRRIILKGKCHEISDTYLNK